MQRVWIPDHTLNDDDAMDIDDERILGDVTSLRASSWQASNDSAFEDTSVHEDGISYFVVLDSNVLISYLPLVRQLHATITRQKLKNVTLCLPDIVVKELNFLKERNPNPNTRALAQAANVWLLAQVRNRSGPLRGQQRHERMKTEEHSRLVNDDHIVDYGSYLLSKLPKDGSVSLLSNDQNCCLKAELQGIITISPKPRTSVETLLPIIMQKPAHSSQLPMPSDTGRPLITAVLKYAHQNSVLNAGSAPIEASMDLDDDIPFIIPSEAHPLSVLHREFLEHLSNLLPYLAYDAALQEQARRAKTEGGTQENVAPKQKSALYASIHAPKTGEVDGAMRAFIMPKVEDVQSWSPLDCIHFVLEFPPTRDGNPAKTPKRRAPTIGKLKLFLLPYDRPGGRKGKDWSVGDWQMALDELEQVASYCDWQGVQESVDICRRQLLERCSA